MPTDQTTLSSARYELMHGKHSLSPETVETAVDLITSRLGYAPPTLAHSLEITKTLTPPTIKEPSFFASGIPEKGTAVPALTTGLSNNTGISSLLMPLPPASGPWPPF